MLEAEAQTVKTVDAAHRPCETGWWWHGASRTAIVESARVIGLADHRGELLVVLSDGEWKRLPQFSSGPTLPGHGSVLAMGPDHPVTGGYLQPATLLSTELWKLAQLQPGDRVRIVHTFG